MALNNQAAQLTFQCMADGEGSHASITTCWEVWWGEIVAEVEAITEFSGREGGIIEVTWHDAEPLACVGATAKYTLGERW